VIWKNRTKIINPFEQKGWSIKRFRKPEWNYVDEALLKLFKQQRGNNVPVSGSLFIKKKKKWNLRNVQWWKFVCCACWVLTPQHLRKKERWNRETSTEWPSVREGYAYTGVFNAVETGFVLD
jgi:hypothetical protein